MELEVWRHQNAQLFCSSFFLTQASTKSEKELPNTSTEALKQLSEMMSEFRGDKAVKRSAF